MTENVKNQISPALYNKRDGRMSIMDVDVAVYSGALSVNTTTISRHL